MTKNRLSLAAAAAAAFGAALPATAAPAAAARGEAFQVSIPAGDLDLATAAGRDALTERVRILAARTCAPKPFPAAYEPASLRACRQAFDAAARAALERSGEARGTR